MDKFINNNFKLSDIKKENPFKIPDNYFDNFSARLQEKLQAEKATVPKPTNRIIQFLKPALGLAASFALIFLLVYWPLKTFVPEQTAGNTENFELIETEFLSLVESIDENSIYTMFQEENSESVFSDEDLMNYVSMNVSNYDLYAGTFN